MSIIDLVEVHEFTFDAENLGIESSGSSAIGNQAFSYAMILGLFGFIMPGVDNYAHAGGFGGGYLAARLLDPLRPERVDHIVIALVCLALSVLSVLVSVIQGMRLLGG